jgi:hypothetical protein
MSGFNLRSGLRAMVTPTAEGVTLNFAKLDGPKVTGVAIELCPDEAARLAGDIAEALLRAGHTP